MGIPGDPVEPDIEFILALVGSAVFQDTNEDILDEVFTDASVAGEPEKKVIKHHMIPLKKNSQFFNVSIPDLHHQIVVRRFIHGCFSLILVISIVKT